eukprot:CAMPEP_0113719098 /NCGR_PEP_ID=MMETSP0038_2-20120614/35598_1 /TAXON_ID=2898 /ORGANISM="Cryptomonas paramecium" /LENGTH=45 /DNA_ID=CAMNT_0000647377 /DNA_START=18 /DNA_END=151 /DNA_ORIENTATION=- /assembly_acc=CAM_ASM_000170
MHTGEARHDGRACRAAGAHIAYMQAQSAVIGARGQGHTREHGHAP